jgi:N-acetylmuramoyl-L-alanine amidase
MVRSILPRRRWTITLIAVPIALAVATLRPPAPAVAPPAVSAPVAEAPGPSATAVVRVDAPVAEAAPAQALAAPTATASPTNTPTPTPSVVPTPTPRAAGTQPHVGIQAGHWLSKDLPDELARLRSSSGAFAAGYAEEQVNLDIARRVAKLLESRGIMADVLPATIPPGYDADAFVAIHADGSSSGNSRGFKLATPWRTSPASQHLADTLTEEYARATGLPQDGAITFNMKGYYAFNNRRHAHAIAKTTPAAIIETGFLTSAADRRLLIGQPDNVAVGIANGIIRYLAEHDPTDGASLIPPDFKTQRPIDPAGLDVRAAPNDKAKLLKHIDADGRIFVFQERDGWYQGVIRGNFRVVGWVRKDQVTATDDPPPTPPPATDS